MVRQTQETGEAPCIWRVTVTLVTHGLSLNCTRRLAAENIRRARRAGLLAACGLTVSCFTPSPSTRHPTPGLRAKILTPTGPARCWPTASAPTSLRLPPHHLFLIPQAKPLTQRPTQVTRQPPTHPTYDPPPDRFFLKPTLPTILFPLFRYLSSNQIPKRTPND